MGDVSHYTDKISHLESENSKIMSEKDLLDKKYKDSKT